MKPRFLVLLVSALVLGSTSARVSAQQGKTLGPTSLSGWRVHYADTHGDYIYRFSKAGTYEMVSVNRSGNPREATSSSGKYRFTRTGPKAAKLVLDDETWTLTFDRPNRATGKYAGDARGYILFFEDPS